MKIVICDALASDRKRMREALSAREPASEYTEIAGFEELTREPIDVELDSVYLLCNFRKARDFLLGKKKPAQTIVFSTKKETYTLQPEQILYAENDGKRIILHTDTGDIVIYASMRELAARLGDDFYRCHRGYLVNMGHIIRYNADSISLDSGDTVYLARGKYREFEERYMEKMKGEAYEDCRQQREHGIRT